MLMLPEPQARPPTLRGEAVSYSVNAHRREAVRSQEQRFPELAGTKLDSPAQRRSSSIGSLGMSALGRPGQLLIGCERLQESDQLYSALRRCQTTVGLHVVAGHCLIGVCDDAFEVFLVPNKVRALHGAGIRVVWQRPSLPSDDASHVRAEPIVALPGRMARSAGVVKQ